ncbi:membrane protein [Streptomyces sp. NRRL S-1831]|uniref:membrane protein n=1 Tax=Streptomyces sp. NRRL S-1831 TaxID=1463890 RepID=UPI0004C7F208|nr:membrane protein [Streptomyces sp. NRRL S-1831]
MSFGDPNNPYGPPQGGQQPNYGYPLQQPQGQPGYGYPQAPPVSAGYGHPAAPTSMPGTVSAARVMLWVIFGLQLVGVVLFALSAASVDAAKNDDQLKDDAAFQQLADYSSGMLWGLVAFALVWGVIALVMAIKVGSGGNGVRIATMIFAIITAILGLYPFIVVGLVHTVLAILVAVFVGNANGAAWYKRPRY